MAIVVVVVAKCLVVGELVVEVFLNGFPGVSGTATHNSQSCLRQLVIGALSHVAGQKNGDPQLFEVMHQVTFASAAGGRGEGFLCHDGLAFNVEY